MELKESELIYDWNRAGGPPATPGRGRVQVNDETLRDGLQSPSVRSPSIEQKLEILHGLVALGVEALDIGLPGAGEHVVRDVQRLAQEIADCRLPISPNCAARTVLSDIRPVVEIAQRTGIAIEVACFIGSSPIRHYAETWDLRHVIRLSREAVGFAAGEGMPVMFVTEDTTRADPEVLRQLYTAAVEAGARRVCIADTVGHATPDGTRALTRFIRQVVDSTGEQVEIDWHGHNDRGLSVINSLAAAEAGADRLHATLLGIGERVGNCPLDQLLVNLQLLGWTDRDLTHLPRLAQLAIEATGMPLPDNYPVLGRDAFRTATGVHAAAIIKARKKGDEWLADRIYSGVPAAMVGCHQVIEIGPMSGESNVHFWLAARGLPQEPDLVSEIFARAKAASAVLGNEEVLAICRSFGVRTE